MPERHYIHDIFPSVECDGADWPKGLSDADKAALTEAVLDVLDMCVPLATYDLYQRIKSHPIVIERAPAFQDAPLLDWRYACVIRAARAAGCEQRWHAPEKPAAPPVPTHKKPRKKPQNG